MKIQDQVVREEADIKRHLGEAGLDYQRWEPAHTVPDDAPAATILAAYATEIETLKKQGGYVTADVIDVLPETPGLDEMLARFQQEHWHDEDEVRFIIAGSGQFHVRPRSGPVLAIEVTAGDLLCVPNGTWHWFHLCAQRRIRAIRLFQDPAGWTPHYTGSGEEKRHQSVCLGSADLPASG